jgi:hypothetical protein
MVILNDGAVFAPSSPCSFFLVRCSFSNPFSSLTFCSHEIAQEDMSCGSGMMLKVVGTWELKFDMI